MADKHIADGESGFLAVSSTPDVCKVGNAAVPFDSFQRLSSEKQYSATVRARGFSVLNVGSVISGTLSNAGSGVMSGTSLGSGDCIILSGSPTVRVEGKAVARHNSDVGMNNQNCLGKLQTLVAPPVVIVKDNSLPCNNPPVSSPTLEALKEAKKKVEEAGFGDEIKQADEWAAKQIDKLRPPPIQGNPEDTIYDYESGAEIPLEVYNARNEINAGVTRGILGTVRGLVSGFASLANAMSPVQMFSKSALDSQILAENIRLGNVCLDIDNLEEDAKKAWEAAKELPEKVWADIQDKWDKASPGDKAELVSRAGSEIVVAFVPAGWFSKAGKVTRAGEVVEATSTLNKAGSGAAKAAEAGSGAGKVGPKEGVKVAKRKKVPCFHPFDKEGFVKLSPAEKKKFLREYAKQLRGQQDGINKMTADQFKAARDVFEDRGRHPGAAKAQGEAKKQKENDIRDSIAKTMRKKNPGMSREEIDTIASQKAADAVKGLAALHVPDMVAGGANKPRTTRMGNSGINSSIGASWNQDKRLTTLDEIAEQLINSGNGSKGMNIELELYRGKGLK